MINRVRLADDEILKGYKFKLYPTKEQALFFDNCINIDRYVYNWAIYQQKTQFEMYKQGIVDHPFITRNEMDALFTELKKTAKFVETIPHTSGRSGIRKCDIAYGMYFDKLNSEPKYRSKKRERKHSYITRAERTYIFHDKVQIEGVPGKYVNIGFDSGINAKRSTNTPHLYNTVIRRDASGDYYLSFKLKQKKDKTFMDKSINSDIQDIAIGIDMNRDKRIQLSTGEFFIGPDLNKEIKQLKRIERKMVKDRQRHNDLVEKQEKTNPDKSIDIPISRRAQKRRQKYVKINKRISNKNRNFVIETCKAIIRKKPSKGFVVEDLDLIEMTNTHRMAKHMVYTNLGRLRDKLKELCNVYDIPFIVADKFYPSSQLCSNCGYRHRKIGYNRTFICPNCGFVMDRDLNAAINLSKLA